MRYFLFLFLFFACDPKENRKNGNNRMNDVGLDKANEINNYSDDNIKTDTLIHCNNDAFKIIIESMQIKMINGVFDKKIQLLLLKDKDTIYNKLFTKEYFRITEQDFLSKATLYTMSIDSVDCNAKEFIFFCAVGVPETDWVYAFNIYINEEGKHRVFELDDEGHKMFRSDL